MIPYLVLLMMLAGGILIVFGAIWARDGRVAGVPRGVYLRRLVLCIALGVTLDVSAIVIGYADGADERAACKDRGGVIIRGECVKKASNVH